MKTEETDLFIKKMMTRSSLEIGKPGFNSIIMQKIMLQEKKKMMKRAILCSFLGLVTLGVIIFLLITTTKQSSIQIIPSTFEGITHWLAANEFLLLPLLVFLLIQKIAGKRLKYA